MVGDHLLNRGPSVEPILARPGLGTHPCELNAHFARGYLLRLSGETETVHDLVQALERAVSAEYELLSRSKSLLAPTLPCLPKAKCSKMHTCRVTIVSRL